MKSEPRFYGDIDWVTLKRGAYRQKSAIWALVFKEFKIKLGKSRIGLFWVLVEPIVSMLMVSGIWYVAGRETIQGTHVMLFIASGFIVFLTVRQGVNYIPHAINANRALLNYPQVKPIDTMLARFIQGMWLHALASLAMLVGLWWIVGVMPTFPDPLLCFQSLGIAMLLALGIALPIGILGTLNESILKLVGVLTQPLMILSGVLYSLNELPVSARELLAYNPIVHLVSAFRYGAFGTKLFPEYSLSYPAFFGFISLGIGSTLYYILRFRLLRK